MSWNGTVASLFHLDGQEGLITPGSASGNMVKLKLVTATAAKTITCLVDKKRDRNNMLYGQNGRAALTFCGVPLVPARPTN